MRCPTCSQAIDPSARFCSKCGSSVEATTPLDGALPPPPSDLAAGRMFAGRFRIVEKAGAGGMGVVYRAVDETLGETVALKLLRPEFVHASHFAERFKREARLTRQLRHRNVCRVFDIGEEEGTLFLSMAWVSGETLRRHMERTRGRLARDQALRIAERIARALAAVHAEGIVHRDLKPGNVMLDDQGEVHVMDFGLARDLQAEESTRTIGPLGTPPYMAPEQRRAERSDSRSDLYALGLILREMLTGERPDPENGLVGDPRAGQGSGLGRLLERLLAPERERRPSDAGQVADEIARLRSEGSLKDRLKGAMQRHPQWSMTLAVAGTLLLVGATFWFLRLGRVPPPEDHISDAELYYARGVHYLREESETVRSIDDAILQFNHAIRADSSFAPAWAGLSEAYWSRFLLDKQAVSREEAIRAEGRAEALLPDDPATRLARAKGLYARGEYQEVEDALGNVFEDPETGDVAFAYAGLAKVALADYLEAQKDLETAVEKNPASHRNWIYLGTCFQNRGEYDEAAAKFRKAAELKPESQVAWANLGASLLYQGRYREAIRPLEKSLEIEENAVARTNLGTAQYALGNLKEAIEHYRIAAETDPHRGVYWANLGDALLVDGRGDEARDAYEMAVRAGRETVRIAPGNMDARSSLGLWAARVGDRETAFAQGKWAVDNQPRNPSFALNYAIIHILFEEDAEGLALLREAVLRMGVSKSDLDIEPAFDRLRQDDRFRTIYQLAS
jgi:serine/threonine-protein kinase